MLQLITELQRERKASGIARRDEIGRLNHELIILRQEHRDVIAERDELQKAVDQAQLLDNRQRRELDRLKEMLCSRGDELALCRGEVTRQQDAQKELEAKVIQYEKALDAAGERLNDKVLHEERMAALNAEPLASTEARLAASRQIHVEKQEALFLSAKRDRESKQREDTQRLAQAARERAEQLKGKQEEAQKLQREQERMMRRQERVLQKQQSATTKKCSPRADLPGGKLLRIALPKEKTASVGSPLSSFGKNRDISSLSAQSPGAANWSRRGGRA